MYSDPSNVQTAGLLPYSGGEDNGVLGTTGAYTTPTDPTTTAATSGGMFTGLADGTSEVIAATGVPAILTSIGTGITDLTQGTATTAATLAAAPAAVAHSAAQATTWIVIGVVAILALFLFSRR